MMTVSNQRLRQWLEVLHEPDAEMSKIAADKLGDMGSAEAVPDLLKAMKGRTALVASACAKALGRIGDKRAAAPLIQTLSSHQDVLVQTAAAEALGALKAGEAVPLLKKVIEAYLQANKHDHFTMTRSHQRGLFIASIDALKAIGTPDALRFANKVQSASRSL
jgi:HEAT repeat protein